MHGVDLYDFHQSLGIQRLGLKCRNEGFSFSENPSGFEKILKRYGFLRHMNG